MKNAFSEEKLTAYILDELSLEDRAIVESEIQSNVDVKEQYEELKSFYGLVGQELAAEPTVSLGDKQKDALYAQFKQAKEDAAAKQEKPRNLKRRAVVLKIIVPMAASIGFVVCLSWILLFGYLGNDKSMEAKSAIQVAQMEEALARISNTAPQPATIASPEPGRPSEQSAAPLSASEKEAIADELRQVLASSYADAKKSSAEPQLAKLSTEATERLKSLGYIKADEAPASGKRKSASIARERAEKRAELAAKISTRGVNKIVGAISADGDGKVADLLRGGEVSADQSRLAQNVGASPEPKIPAELRQKLEVLGYMGGDDPESVKKALIAQTEKQKEPEHNTESYDRIYENPFLSPKISPLSTFSIDVDTASYANMRRFLNNGSLPPKDAVRIEELINYFNYEYPAPEGNVPFSVATEIADAPWKKGHRLVRIGLKGKAVSREMVKPSNLVFLVDTSGSMQSSDKIELLKKSMRLLVDNLKPRDTIAIVAYAGSAGLVLPSTQVKYKSDILASLERLSAGGSTNGGAGIELAYKVAGEHFIKDGNNRVILATDGDFNVGVTNRGDLSRLIESKRKSNIFLSVIGFGMGNYKDATMEELSNKGNGNYAYIDTLQEAKKVFVKEMGATLYTIAKDVKIQIEFNPAKVAAYRLIGYENRMLKARDFNDDKKDAGEIGAGHTVTALYEVIPVGLKQTKPAVDALKYQQPAKAVTSANELTSNEMLNLKLRYKTPKGSKSKLIEIPVIDTGKRFDATSIDFRWAASVAAFGMLLRDSKYKGHMTFNKVQELARQGMGADQDSYRTEFLSLIQKANSLKR